MRIYFLALLFTPTAFAASLFSSPPSQYQITIEDGRFEPDVMGVNNKKNSTLVFFMKDNSSCKEKVIVKGLDVEIPLKLKQKVSVSFKNKPSGRYHMECETGEFCGVLFILDPDEKEPDHVYNPHP